MSRRLKLSTQLIILFGLVITLSAVLSTGFSLFRQSQELRQTLQDRGRVLAELTAEFLLTPLYFNEVDEVRDLVTGLVQNEDVSFAIAKNATGDTIGQAGMVAGIPDSILERVAAAAQQQNETVLVDTAGQILIAIPIRRESLHAGILTVGLSLERVQSQLRTAAVESILATLLWVVLGLVGIVWVARYLTKSIHNLTKAAEAIRHGNYDISLPPANSQELNELGLTFKQMADSVQTSQMGIESRVVERTRQLEAVADITGRINAILDLDQLLNELVNQVKLSFDYYHTQVYLLDTERQNLVMRAGAGEIGAQMKARGHHIPLAAPTSLVARAARSAEIVSVDNVREAEDWLPNPLLPDTYSEMAIPIVLEGQVVGVLDVQADEIADLDEGDAGLLRSLANQVANAIRNARLFKEVEAALAETQAAQTRYLEQAWDQTKIAARQGQYHYARPDAPALAEATLAEANRQALAQDHPAMVAIKGNEAHPPTVVAAVTFRNTPIGALQLYPARTDQIWTEDDLAIVEAVVDELGQAAENLRLFEKTRERAGREATIREITEKMRAAPSLEKLVKTAAEELGRRFSADLALVEFGIEPANQPAVGPANGRKEDQ
jgi:GAF domain-containing protein